MLKIAKTHEWTRVEGDLLVIGITPYAVEELGEVVFLELPEVGDSVSAGVSFGEIESVKAASELIAPCDGEVVAVNTDIEDDEYATLSEDPLGAGWMIKIKAEDTSPLDDLMTQEEYDTFVKED